jgi:hypothetical protein
MKWIEFLKHWSATHSIPYSKCLKDPQCKEAYHKQKDDVKEVEEGNKIFRQKRATNKLLNFNEETIEVPRELALDDKIVPALTKSNSITKRNKKPSINLVPVDDNKINIISDNKPQEKKFRSLKRELKKTVKQNNEKFGINGPEVIDEY